MITLQHLFTEIVIDRDDYVRKANKKLKKKYHRVGNITSTLKSKWKYFQKHKKSSKSLQITPQDKNNFIAASAPRNSKAYSARRRREDEKNIWMAIQHFKNRR